jgi:hypothetical protein
VGEDQIADGRGRVKLEINSAEIEQFLKLLAEAPRCIATATKDLAEVRLYLRTKEEPWFVSDILAQLRASADVREKFIHIMLTQEHPTLRYISPRSYIKKTNYLELPFPNRFRLTKSSVMNY